MKRPLWTPSRKAERKITLYCPVQAKKCYFSKSEARRALRSYQGQNRGYEGVPYNCPHCGYFHFGRPFKKKK
jgi:hypothetical protein